MTEPHHQFRPGPAVSVPDWRRQAWPALVLLALAALVWWLLRTATPADAPADAPAAKPTQPVAARPEPRPAQSAVHHGGGGGTQLDPELADKITVSLAQMSMSRQVAFHEPKRGDESFEVTLRVGCHGEIQPLACGKLVVGAALTDSGEPLVRKIQFDGEEDSEPSPYDTLARSRVLLWIQLVPPQRPARGLKRFAGELDLRYTTGVDEVELKPLADWVGRCANQPLLAEVGFELEKVDAESRQVVSRIRQSDPSRSVGDRTFREVKLFSADGQRLYCGMSTVGDDQGMRLTHMGLPATEGIYAVVVLNREEKTATVPFDLADCYFPDGATLADAQAEAAITDWLAHMPEDSRKRWEEAKAQDEALRQEAEAADPEEAVKFAVMPMSLQLQRAMSIGAQDDQPSLGNGDANTRNDFWLMLNVACPPGSEPTEEPTVILKEVLTAEGERLSLLADPARWLGGFGRGFYRRGLGRGREQVVNVPAQCQLTVPSNLATKGLSRVGGEVLLHYAKAVRPVELRPLKDWIGRCQAQPELAAVGFELVAVGETVQYRYNMSAKEFRQVRFFGPDGAELPARMSQGSGDGGQQMTCTWQGQNPVPAGAYAVVELNTDLRAVLVPFELKDLYFLSREECEASAAADRERIRQALEARESPGGAGQAGR